MNPFKDPDNLIRVGVQIANSGFLFPNKNLITLPAKLIIKNKYHRQIQRWYTNYFWARHHSCFLSEPNKIRISNWAFSFTPMRFILLRNISQISNSDKFCQYKYYSTKPNCWIFWLKTKYSENLVGPILLTKKYYESRQ